MSFHNEGRWHQELVYRMVAEGSLCKLAVAQGGEGRQERSAALVKIEYVLKGMAPASDGGENAPGQESPEADAPSARRRPGYPLVGCSPAEPTAVSPGGRRVSSRNRQCKAMKGRRPDRVQDKVASAAGGRPGQADSNGGSGAEPRSNYHDGSPALLSNRSARYSPDNLNSLSTVLGELQSLNR
jgi:hypothetical protein